MGRERKERKKNHAKLLIILMQCFKQVLLEDKSGIFGKMVECIVLVLSVLARIFIKNIYIT